MEDIYTYRVLFCNLKLNTFNGDYAPHKPILLISIMDLVLLKYINTPLIIKDRVLNNFFKYNWERYVGVANHFTADITRPFNYLNNESFWHPVNKNIAEIDEKLFELMKNAQYYLVLKKSLINTYISQSAELFQKELETNTCWPYQMQVNQDVEAGNVRKKDLPEPIPPCATVDSRKKLIHTAHNLSETLNDREKLMKIPTKIYVKTMKTEEKEGAVKLNIVYGKIPLIDL